MSILYSPKTVFLGKVSITLFMAHMIAHKGQIIQRFLLRVLNLLPSDIFINKFSNYQRKK